MVNNSNNAEPIRYALVQNERTGALWAFKCRGKVILGARSFENQPEPFLDDLPSLTYDVGHPRDYVEAMLPHHFAVWPFGKSRSAETAPTADN